MSSHKSMQFGFFVLIYFLLILAPGCLRADDDDVLVLTNSNFDDAVRDHKYLLVEFYASWCRDCTEFAPEFAKAAEKAEDIKPKVIFAKVDAEAEKELAKEFNIRAYPTLWFFKNGKKITFKGVEKADDVLRLLKKKTGYPAEILKTAEQAERFKDGADVTLVGFFKNNKSEEADDFIEVAEEIDDFPFAITSNDEVYKKLQVKRDGVVLFKNFDDGRSDFLDLKRFIEKESLPLVMEFNQETSRKIFGDDIKQLCVLLINEKNPKHLKLLDGFNNAAIFFEDKVRFIYADMYDKSTEMISDMFGLKKSDAPALRFLKMSDKGMKKFQPETKKISEMAARDFVEDVLDGDIKPYFKSQDLPQDWDKEAVKVLVKSNFKKIALDPSKKVLVEFYAPWCGHCKKLAPIYDELGKKYKNNKRVVIAKIDATANEFEDFEITGLPTIKLYKSVDNKVMNFKGENTLDALSKFIDSDGSEGGVEDDDDDGDDDDDDDDHNHDEL